MSIFHRLFGSSDSREILDPVFGPLSYEQAVWTGRAHAAGQSFRIFLIGGSQGPSAEQRSFFVSIIARLPVLIDTAKRFVHEQTHSGGLSELRLYAIEVGPDTEVMEQRFTIQLSPPDNSEVHRVEFRGLEALSYGCDD